MNQQANNPLHGITLEQIVVKLEQTLGWKAMGEHVDIRCFKSDPSVKSSLKFLRKTPWARTKVEQLYLDNCVDTQPQNSGFVWPSIKKK
ncbi:VF530 family DNA-binding protein [Pseudoalteromonas ostreae]|uniref:VF530 family protein n=1 Tax=Pseudoalteromonas ostreae TaxID=2774154 RepID=UPI001B36F23F|nr:VF530 family protein [Pseudoalteromonas ostreae]